MLVLEEGLARPINSEARDVKPYVDCADEDGGWKLKHPIHGQQALSPMYEHAAATA